MIDYGSSPVAQVTFQFFSAILFLGEFFFPLLFSLGLDRLKQPKLNIEAVNFEPWYPRVGGSTCALHRRGNDKWSGFIWGSNVHADSSIWMNDDNPHSHQPFSVMGLAADFGDQCVGSCWIQVTERFGQANSWVASRQRGRSCLMPSTLQPSICMRPFQMLQVAGSCNLAHLFFFASKFAEEKCICWRLAYFECAIALFLMQTYQIVFLILFESFVIPFRSILDHNLSYTVPFFPMLNLNIFKPIQAIFLCFSWFSDFFVSFQPTHLFVANRRYLDTDVVVKSDLTELLSVPFRGHPAAAAEDCSQKMGSFGGSFQL